MNALNLLQPWRLPPGVRRTAAGAVAALAVALLAACANPSPPPMLYQLRSQPEGAAVTGAMGAAAPDAPSAAAAPLQLQLMLPVTLPEVLDRDVIVVARGQAGVQALAGHRWAEPLRDAVPRLLRHDLSALLSPGAVWAAPLPAGLQVQRQLRVDVLTLQADASRSQVQMQVRWTVSDPVGRLPARTGVENLASPVSGSDVDALVAAHRQVLWLLAQRLARLVP